MAGKSTSLLVLGFLALVACGGPHAEPPRGIFLIVVDTLRADYLSCYGYAGHETPHVDGLAARGVRFTQAHSVASWTVPSMGALFTARLPRQLGLLEAPDDRSFGPFELREQRSLALPEQGPHLAEELRRRGFRTAGFVDQPMLDHHSGFQRGFDDWFHVVSRGEVRRFDPANADEPSSWDDTAFAYQNDAALVQRFAAWLSRLDGEARAFAWLHLLTPHTPYLPPADFAPAAGEKAGPLSAAAYAGEVRASDALVGWALEAVEKYVGLDRALVVFTADHGEALGDHGELGHGQSLHREVLQVPLILSGPGVPRGATLDGLVRSIDIAPTILALAGAASPPEGFAGESLLPLLDGAASDRTLYAEGMLYGPSERSLTANGYKLLLDAQTGSSQLFSLVDDPRERNDLAAQSTAETRALRAKLDAAYATLQKAFDAERGPPTRPSEHDRAALRALGYLEGEAKQSESPDAGDREPADLESISD